MVDWVLGDKFQQVATFTFAPPVLNRHDYAQIPNTFDANKLKDGDIVYCVGFYYYKHELLKAIKDTKEVILISHNCDEGIDSQFEVPDNVIKWYGQNIKVMHPKIESIPTGLENVRWFPQVKKKEKMLAKLKERRDILNLVYMDHRIYSNPAERVRPYEILGNKPFVTSITEKNIVPFDTYLHYIYNHKFVISPEGNGVQTHRPWEVLHMGSIPIERRNVNNTFYEDLPICFVDDWEEVTENFLCNWLIENRGKKWNMDKLNFSYWKDKICG